MPVSWNLLMRDTLLIALITLVIFVVMELGARVLIYSEWVPPFYMLPSELAETGKIRAAPHHYLNHYPRPNYENGKNKHNSMGFRGPEFSLEKPPSIYRIVALGGSTTYTTKVDDDARTYPAQLQTVLRDKYGHQNVEVINAGVPGYNSWETLINLQFRVLDLEPDLVIIYHAHNDVHARLVEPSAYHGDNSGRRRQWGWDPPWWGRSALLRLIVIKLRLGHMPGVGNLINNPDTYMGLGSDSFYEIEEHALHDLLNQNPPGYFSRNLEYMVAATRLSDTKIMFATFAYTAELDDYAAREAYRRGTDEGNEVVKRVASKHNVPVFDFASLMPTDKRYWGDGVHVNDDGALLKAELFARFISETFLHNTAALSR